MNPVKTFKNCKTESLIEQSRKLCKTLGFRSAAGLLRNKGYSLEATMWLLCRKGAV
jgi:hypothetical protein